MSYFFIKIIAIICMLIDHIGYILLDNNIYCRLIGRIAFPLFCFLLVNGFHHTKNKTKYILRMAIFAFISEIPFDLACFGELTLKHQNVYFTLTIGLSLMFILDKFKDYVKNEMYLETDKVTNIFSRISESIGMLLFMGLSMALNSTLKADYGWFGIILIYGFYISYGINFKNKIKMSLLLIIINILYALFNNTYLELYSLFALIPIFLFKDKEIYINKYIKLFCYWFYPLHLLILFILKNLF